MNKILSAQPYALGLLSLLALPLTAEANPWLDTGDMQLRHELQLLSDSGMLDAPLTTWPLATKDIQSKLKQTSAQLQPELMSVLANINKRLEKEDYGSSQKAEIKGMTKKLLVRDFSAEGREKSTASYEANWGNPMIDARLKVSVAEKTSHPNDKNIRLDESYLASSLGNWKFTVGRQSRWWGPSWDGSLILSNNARPIPSLSFENVDSKAFKNKWLHWLGPNKLHFFIGQLESNRAVPNAKLIGTRFTFKPLKSLEVGMNRTIQWGGKGQNNSFSNLLKTLAGARDSTSDGSLGTVGGNQIAGLDVRWNIPTRSNKNKYSLYGQYIGEDRVDGSLLLGDETFLVGGSVSGLSPKLGGTWRTYIEATDTSAAWFKGRARNDIIYNHSTYTDGYRHLGLSMGHGIDSNGKMVSVGTMLSQNNGNFWRGWAKHAKINAEGLRNPLSPAGKTWSAVGVSLNKKLNKKTKLNLGLQLISEKETGKSRENDIGASVGFSYSF